MNMTEIEKSQITPCATIFFFVAKSGVDLDDGKYEILWRRFFL